MFAQDANTLWPQEPMTLLIVDTRRIGQQGNRLSQSEALKNRSFGLSWCIYDHSIFNILDMFHNLCTYEPVPDNLDIL